MDQPAAAKALNAAGNRHRIRTLQNMTLSMRAFQMIEMPQPTARGERAAVIALVAGVHLGLLWAWSLRPAPPAIVVDAMSVSVALQQAEAARPQAQPQTVPSRAEARAAVVPPSKVAPPQRTAEPEPTVAAAVAPPSAAPPPAVAAPAAPAQASVPDTVPDYRAAYLNNPRPAYPMAARRMGWEGRVVLNVEVLASGLCGDANVSRSSGHEVLDNVALRTVKGWRFVPASRAGHAVTQWFQVPIQFSLKENEA